MDLGTIFTGIYIMPFVVNLICLLGMFTLGLITYKVIYTSVYYLKFKHLPTNEIEYKYINMLEENKILKQKVAELEEDYNNLFSQLLEHLKGKRNE